MKLTQIKKLLNMSGAVELAYGDRVNYYGRELTAKRLSYTDCDGGAPYVVAWLLHYLPATKIRALCANIGTEQPITRDTEFKFENGDLYIQIPGDAYDRWWMVRSFQRIAA